MTGRIFITGDKHGSLVPFFGLAQRNELTPADILLIAGDAGYVWREHDSSPSQPCSSFSPAPLHLWTGIMKTMRFSTVWRYSCGTAEGSTVWMSGCTI